MSHILIKNPQKKKHIKCISDWTADQFGFDFLELETKETNLKGSEILEKEKVKVFKAFLKQQNKTKEKALQRMFFYNKPILISKKDKKRKNIIGLDIINIPTAIAEAIVIKTATAILVEEGYKNISISLNAIGGKNSQLEFKNALIEYYQKHKSKLKTFEKNKILSDPFSIYFNKSKKYLEDVNVQAPKSINFLSDDSIRHFQETIEYIESMNIPYKIEEDLIGSQLFFSKTIFKIFASETDKKVIEEVGYGGRYDEISSSIAKTSQNKISAIGLVLNFKKKNNKKLKLKEKKYNLHLLKIGSTAKLKSLEVLGILNKMQIPIEYKINQEKISEQIQTALEQNADYALMIGEIEAKNDKILIRNMKNASQQEVEIKKLPQYIKKFLK